MFFVILFFAAGGAYVMIDKLATVLALLLVATVVAVPIFLGLAWVSDLSGASDLIESSVLWLAGQDSLGTIYPKEGCPPHLEETAWSIAGIFTTLFSALMAGVALFGMPIGIIKMLFGIGPMVNPRYYRDTHWLKKGLRDFTIGVSGVILCGLGFRLLNWLYDGYICMPPSS